MYSAQYEYMPPIPRIDSRSVKMKVSVIRNQMNLMRVLCLWLCDVVIVEVGTALGCWCWLGVWQ